MYINWEAVTGIGTVLAAVVGIAGIWINLWEKKRKLTVTFELIPRISLYLCNNSLRSIAVTKIVGIVGSSVFYVNTYNGLQEVVLAPSTVMKLDIDKSEIYSNYFDRKMDALYNPNEKIVLVLHDNYGRKYKVNTNTGISAFEINKK